MREGTLIGVMGLARPEVKPFNAKEIELAATFADQAVIAIENVRLFEAEQQRTRELTEIAGTTTLPRRRCSGLSPVRRAIFSQCLRNA